MSLSITSLHFLPPSIPHPLTLLSFSAPPSLPLPLFPYSISTLSPFEASSGL